MIDRRKFLQLAGVAPLVSLAKPAEAALPSPAPEPPKDAPLLPEGDFSNPDGEWMEMAERLWGNLESYWSGRWTSAGGAPLWGKPPSEKEREATYSICYRFCRNLRDYELSAPFMPKQGPEPFEKLQFMVTDGPIATVAGVSKPAWHRRLRANWSAVAQKDATCGFGGLSALEIECEIFEALAQQTALEVQMEIRQAWKEGRPVRVYALFLPPHLTPVFVDPKDFSFHRQMRIRYAKFT